MERSIDSLEFTEREWKYYSAEFDQVTNEQEVNLNDRVLSGQEAATFFRQLRIKEPDLAKIWEFVAEGKSYLGLKQFMAAMRLCSAIKQNKPLIAENYLTEQNVLARKSKTPAEVIENKIPIEPLIKEVPSIPLQVSQEVMISRIIGEESYIEAEESKESGEMLKVKGESNDRNEGLVGGEGEEENLKGSEKSEEKQEDVKIEVADLGFGVDEVIKEEEIGQSEDESKQIRENLNLTEPLTPPNIEPYDPPKLSTVDLIDLTSAEINSVNPLSRSNEKPTYLRSLPPDSKPGPYISQPSISPTHLLPDPHPQPKPISLLSLFPPVSSFPSSKDSLITVEVPILITSGWLGSKSFHLYTINSRISNKIFTVKRRFSDLDWMHQQLCLRHKGLIIPTLPSKKFIKNTHERFIEERRVQMEKYLDIIARHNELSCSVAFKVFIQTPNEKFDKEKAKVEADVEVREYSSIEDVVDKVYASVQNKLEMVFAHKIVPFSRDMSEVEEKLIRLEAPIQMMTGSFSRWVKVQVEAVKALTSTKVSEEFESISADFKVVNWKFAQELQKVMLDVQEEQLRLEGLKEALNSYKYTVEESCKLQTLIGRKLSKHKSSTNEDTAARYLSEIQATQELIDKFNRKLEEIEINILKENKTFDSHRAENLEDAITSLVSLQKARYAQESVFWTECLNRY